MPTYEYECSACSHRLEAFQSIMVKPLRKCPKCGKRSLARVIGSGAALLFRGPGFYITDNRSSEYRKAAKSDSKDAKAADKSSSEPSKAAPTASPQKDAPAAEKGSKD